MGILKGIDVSNRQGNINWSAVKNSGVDFAIIRAGYGRLVEQKDAQFENNYTGCKSNGIPCGVYWFSYATSEDEAIEEAKVCLETIKGKTFEYPIYFDMENSNIVNLQTLGKEKCTAIASAFLSTVESAGYWVGLYMSKSPILDFIDESIRKRYAVWIAQYNECCSYPDYHGMWQKASDSRIDGINGNVDIDECYFDYISAIKTAGLNGFSKPVSVTPQISTPASVQSYTVQKGDTLWGISQTMLKNGSRYREIMVLSGLTSDTIYPGQKLVVPMY